MPVTPQSPDEGPRNLFAPGDFSDPDAWGYCKFCAFEVAVDIETGKMLFHEPLYSGSVRKECPGNGKFPTPQPGPTAEPIKLVNLRKSIQQIGMSRLKYEEKYRERDAAYRDGVTRPTPRPVTVVEALRSALEAAGVIPEIEERDCGDNAD